MVTSNNPPNTRDTNMLLIFFLPKSNFFANFKRPSKFLNHNNQWLCKIFLTGVNFCFKYTTCYHQDLGIFMEVWLFQKSFPQKDVAYGCQITFWNTNRNKIQSSLFCRLFKKSVPLFQIFKWTKKYQKSHSKCCFLFIAPLSVHYPLMINKHAWINFTKFEIGQKQKK